MIFKFVNEEYDSEKLSEKGKIYLNKLNNITAKKNQLVSEYTDCEVLQKNYIELLKEELPKKEVKKTLSKKK
jgi:hypothetical protein|tara:strand:- start:394 stop:609 length:216 start_codon:yes stop_codon:yes gene_type:complete